jgi:eukaryotic-like serine/threonine-protein kinase
MPLDPRRVKALFNAALDLPDPADRPALLDRECGDDRQLRQRLGDLLAAYDQPDGALKRPLAADLGQMTGPDGGPIRVERLALAADAMAAGPDQRVSYRLDTLPPDALIGSVVASRYKLRQEIGEGGMGSVYLAEQTQPVKLQVARKLIDFGLAKATSGLRLTEHSLDSAFGTVAGTPLYMAPEQASLNALDVDTRVDVYALGVILYELLTGNTPIQRETFRRAALDEMLRLIREVDPPTPSSRISTSHTLASLAATRHIVPARLGRFVRGELDWIVMKALAKERQRRYESPSAFAHDIERFLTHEPVSAGPPTASYRFKKFVRRNRVQVITGSLVLVALVGGIVGTTLGLIEATRQRRIAVAAGDAINHALRAEALQRQRADALRQQAEKRLTQIETADDILGSIFKYLNPKTVEKAGKPLFALLGEHLDQATAQIEGEAIGDPLMVARVQQTLGDCHLALGNPEKAIGLLAMARATFVDQLGFDHADTLTNMASLAGGYKAAGKFDQALPLLEQTLALRKAKLGADHPDTLSTMGNLAGDYLAAGERDRALPLLEESFALVKARLGPDHFDTLACMSNLATGYFSAGKLDRALPLFEQTHALMKAKLGPDCVDTVTVMNNLASIYQVAGKLDRALPLYEEIQALTNAKLGPDHPDTLTSMSNLAMCYQSAGKPDRALPLRRELANVWKRIAGADSLQYGGALVALGLNLLHQKNWAEAEAVVLEALAIRDAKEPDAWTTFDTESLLGGSLLGQKRYAEAAPLL